MANLSLSQLLAPSVICLHLDRWSKWDREGPAEDDGGRDTFALRHAIAIVSNYRLTG
jgi:hypothetical protein